MPKPVAENKTEETADIQPAEITLSAKDQARRSYILTRAFRAKEQRDSIRQEFGNMTYLDYYRANERIANTVTEKKEFDSGIVVGSGTVEQKLYAVVAEINRLNLSFEVRAYDQEDYELVELGRALTDVIAKSEDIEEDQENKLLRQVELFKQGTVFVQENWVRDYRLKKTLNSPFNGKVTGVTWESKLEKCYEGARRTLLFLNGSFCAIKSHYVKRLPLPRQMAQVAER